MVLFIFFLHIQLFWSLKNNCQKDTTLQNSGMDKKIKIGFLYQDLMNTYGDSGNVEVLQKRLGNQGFQTQIINLSTDTNIKQFQDVDFYFFGGGQDQNQEFV